MTRIAMLVVRALLAAAVLGASVPVAAQMIARLETVQGVVALQRINGKSGLAAAGTELNVGDVVSTMKDSTALLVFTDQTQIAMRPSSRVTVADYAFKEAEPTEDRMAVRLLKGGMRTLSGLIGKRGDPGAFHLTAAGATMGRGATDFIARVCETDCAPAPRSKEGALAAPASASGTVGRVAAISGHITATSSAGGASRPLALQTPLFEKDVVTAAEGSSALLMMSDGSQLQVKSKTTVALSSYRYDTTRLDQNKQTLDMAAGSARFNSGNIGKLQPTAVQVKTITASIGVRGTSFDVACAGPGAHEVSASAETGACGQATYLHTREGKTVLTSGGYEREFTAGQTAYVPQPGAAPVLLAQAPTFLTQSATATAPTSSAAEPAPAALPGSQGSGNQTLYVAVNEGLLTVQRGLEQILVNRGEAAYAPVSGGSAVKLAIAPRFLDNDPFLSAPKFLDASCFER